MKDGVLAPDAVKVRTHCPNCSAEGCDLIKSMLEKNVDKRPSARQVLEHDWFKIKGMPLDNSTKQMLHLRTSKGVAHSILMNALALKVHRDHYDECKAIFNEADEDHSGTIDKAEFVKAATKLKLLGKGTDVAVSATSSEITISTKEAARMFESIDIDKTGDINFNEFLAMSFDWSKLSVRELEGNLKKLFSDMDKDGNGLIDISELRDTFQGVVDDEEIDILMSTCSKNGVELSLDEVKSFLFDEGSNRSYTDHMQKVVTHKAKKRKEVIEENCCLSGVCVCLSAILIWKCWLTPGL
jgi:calcium-dependent protein kinase